MPIKLQGPPAPGHNRGDAAARAAPAPGMSVSIDADIVVHSCGYVHQVARLVPPRATAKLAAAQSRRRLAPGRFVLVALVVALTALAISGCGASTDLTGHTRG